MKIMDRIREFVEMEIDPVFEKKLSDRDFKLQDEIDLVFLREKILFSQDRDQLRIRTKEYFDAVAEIVLKKVGL